MFMCKQNNMSEHQIWIWPWLRSLNWGFYNIHQDPLDRYNSTPTYNVREIKPDICLLYKSTKQGIASLKRLLKNHQNDFRGNEKLDMKSAFTMLDD